MSSNILLQGKVQMLEQLKDCIVLYHGSYCEVKEPDLQKCARFKDFGQGFYLTTDRNQAFSFAKISTQRMIENKILPSNRNYGIVSSFIYRENEFCNIKYFETADIEWLHCIVAHRKIGAFANVVEQYRDFDIVAGKVANDATNSTIVNYMARAFGPVGSATADSICIGLLLPERLKNQYCFRTAKAIRNLVFKGCEKVWM